MRRYLLFAGIDYEDVHLGWDGFVRDFDAVSAAKDTLNSCATEDCDWYQIVDVKSKVKIEYGRREKEGWLATRSTMTGEG